MSTSTYVAASSLRRASIGSATTMSRACAHCAPSRPASKASPIFPPPTIVNRAVTPARLRLRQVRAGVAGGAAEAGFEVEVGAGRVAGGADVADDVALVDVLALVGGESRLVGVQRREAAAVVDDDHVAVAAHHAREYDRARLGRLDRRAVAACDVLALVHAAPPHAEARRQRAAARPDETEGRRRSGGTALGGRQKLLDVAFLVGNRFGLGRVFGDARVEGAAQSGLGAQLGGQVLELVAGVAAASAGHVSRLR